MKILEKLKKLDEHESIVIKAPHKLLVKWSPDVNFINVLQAAFTHADPKRTKKTVKSGSFFVLSGSVCVKATHKHVDEIKPRWVALYTSVPRYSGST